MYLKSITVRGFKSFARKTVLEFEPGVTVIVGPNGVGKSNIADAVMWVLGEQSPTSLRGARMEDVIFSGSSSQRSLGLAEVSLVLENSNGEFPCEYSDVMITRNVVRGGDSEYRLNNRPCRLLDIQEMLSDAGVGRTLNSVVSQGQLDEVLSCHPDERRGYIEEAGGLLKFRRRREKTLRRLERMDDELLRINDVIREVRRQLRPLARQADRLEQYQELNRELKDTRLRLDVARLRALQKEWEAHDSAQRSRAERLASLEKEISELVADADSLEEGEKLWRERDALLRDRLYSLVACHEQLKALFPVWEEKLKLLQARSRASFDRAGHVRLKARIRELEKRGSTLGARLLELREEEREKAARLTDLRRRLNEAAREIMGLEARIDVLNSPVNGPAGSWLARIQECRDELDTLTAERERTGARIEALEKERAEVRRLISELEREALENRKEKERLSAGLRSAAGEQARLLARLELLSHLDTYCWGPLNSAQSLIVDDPTGGRLGGMLMSSLTVDEEHQLAVMNFLGPWVYGVVARDSDAIQRSVEYLKEKGLGQSLFFRYAEEPLPPVDQPPAPEGSVRARDVVRAPRWFDDALDVLLEGVFLVSDLGRAFALAEKYPDLVFLTSDGDAISGSLVKGGSGRVGRVHLELTASRRRITEEELDACRLRTEDLELRLQACAAREWTLLESMGDARRRLDRLEERRARLFAQAASIESRISSTEDEKERLSSAVVDPSDAKDTAELERKLLEMRAGERDLAAGLEEVERGLREVLEEIRSLETRSAAVKGELDALGDRERKMAAAATDEGTLSGDATTLTVEEKDIKLLESLHSRLLEAVHARRERVRAELESGSGRLADGAERLRETRARISQCRSEHEALRDRMHGDDLSVAELKIRVEQLVESIVDGYKVPLEFALQRFPEEPPGEELESRVAELAEKLEHIGPVNPEAITEREALQERYDFLREQLEDVRQGMAELRRVIRQVDREIEEKFKSTVDEVNRHFQDIFSFLFPGGRAEIRLTDPEDLLRTGVEIYAQPEGKRLRRISLLSGGETAMTAIAFFFALFRVRPSPFYILDEVEAALDDVNLHRFLELVKQFRERSQLILITHQKRSMEIADTLYGVSMQEDGVSKVISQRVAV